LLCTAVDDSAEGGRDEAVEGVEAGGSGDLDSEFGPGAWSIRWAWGGRADWSPPCGEWGLVGAFRGSAGW